MRKIDDDIDAAAAKAIAVEHYKTALCDRFSEPLELLLLHRLRSHRLAERKRIAKMAQTLARIYRTAGKFEKAAALLDFIKTMTQRMH